MEILFETRFVRLLPNQVDLLWRSINKLFDAKLYEFYQAQILAVDAQIEQCLASFADKVDVTQQPLPKPKRRGKKQPGNAPQFDLRTHLYRISGVDFTAVDGFGALTVLILLSELGLDPSRFPTVKHFTSWLGLCPGQKITGGKVKSSKTRPVVNRAANALGCGLFLLPIAVLRWVLFTDVYDRA